MLSKDHRGLGFALADVSYRETQSLLLQVSIHFCEVEATDEKNSAASSDERHPNSVKGVGTQMSDLKDLSLVLRKTLCYLQLRVS